MIWSYRQNGKKAEIALVNNLYRYEIWELWLDRQGRLEHLGRLLLTGSEKTLEAAKIKALEGLR